MSRAAFLSAGGDPFIVSLVLKLFKERFYNEIDKMYICYNNHAGVPVDVASEFVSKVVRDPKVHLIYHPNGIGNGIPITEMTLIAKEDLVMLLEDDGFIFESGAVSKCFQDIESDLTDMVGSLRYAVGEIAEAAKVKYNLDYSGYGDVGPWFWPNFFFCKRADLLKTDLNFASVTFKEGDYCKELNHTFKEIAHGDTFVWACIQLRALGLRSHSIPQHHASPYEITDKGTQQQNWHPTQSWFPWIHGGSLSTSWGGYLQGVLPPINNEIDKLEIETRCSFWKIAAEQTEGYEEFKKQYLQGIENLIANSNLNRDRIQKKYNIYLNLLRL